MAAGYGRHAVQRLIESGAWVRLRPGVLAAAEPLNHPDPARRHAVHVAAALLSLGVTDAVASHESAALLHGIALLDEPAAQVSLTRPPGGVHRDRIRGGRLHRAELPANQVGRLHGVPVTSAARTVADLARRLPYRDAVVAADSAMFRRVVRREEVEDALAACAGWPGSAAAARALAAADAGARSPLGTLARLMCAAAGLPEPQVSAYIDGELGICAEADLYWQDLRVILLVDGLLKYRDVEALRAEKLLQERLERDGFTVLRLTWADVTQHPARSVERIRAAFARHGAGPEAG